MVLEQSTGAKDKNGKEIFVGDILRVTFIFNDEKTVYFEGEPYLITVLNYDFKQEIHNPRSELRGKRMVHLSTLETQCILMFELKQSFTEIITMDAEYVLDHYNKTQSILSKGGKRNENK